MVEEKYQHIVKKKIIADCYRYYGADDFKTRLKTHGLQAAYRYTKLYRKVHWYKNRNAKIRYIIFQYLLLRSSYKYGYQINADVEIGPGLYLGHRGMIIINQGARLGKNINIQAGVTIGQENRGKRKGAPSIGDNVWIGANAVIVGKIVIGNNVLIAPNSYVNFDIPEDSIVLGNPAKIIHNENATKDYIQNSVN